MLSFNHSSEGRDDVIKASRDARPGRQDGVFVVEDRLFIGTHVDILANVSLLPNRHPSPPGTSPVSPLRAHAIRSGVIVNKVLIRPGNG